ncbi:hypothetical protein RJ640_012527 [Escallonia rubra]|uniref:Uncharacterized protein n=1 Tax=Escallonia rubra TaxID=112253 RepID=A0AA88UUU4_9ASTE|nr:hypothetical protein RJ640_012527 [Escallonia rubra]
MPYGDNYGSFFGRSQPYLAPRLLQKTSQLLEEAKKTAAAKTGVSGTLEHVNEVLARRAKIEKLAASGDYSFLSSSNSQVFPHASTKNLSLNTHSPSKSKTEEKKLVGRKMLRKLTGYDPRKYANEKDDVVETNFGGIEKDERRSAKLARKEDAEEILKIEAEERKERLMRKKPKLMNGEKLAGQQKLDDTYGVLEVLNGEYYIAAETKAEHEMRINLSQRKHNDIALEIDCHESLYWYDAQLGHISRNTRWKQCMSYQQRAYTLRYTMGEVVHDRELEYDPSIKIIVLSNSAAGPRCQPPEASWSSNGAAATAAGGCKFTCYGAASRGVVDWIGGGRDKEADLTATLGFARRGVCADDVEAVCRCSLPRLLQNSRTTAAQQLQNSSCITAAQQLHNSRKTAAKQQPSRRITAAKQLQNSSPAAA